MPSPSFQIETNRLRLIPATAEMLRLELTAPVQLAQKFHAELPSDWPPGEYDEGAIRFFLEQAESFGPDGEGWFTWYALHAHSEGQRLVGCGGFIGVPDEKGCVEIGYSIAETERGQGFATEMVAALTVFAFERGARRIVAHTIAANPASIAVLTKNAFVECGQNAEGMIEFVRIA